MPFSAFAPFRQMLSHYRVRVFSLYGKDADYYFRGVERSVSMRRGTVDACLQRPALPASARA